MKQIFGNTVLKIGILFFSAIFFVGCAVQTKVMKTDSAFRPAKSPSEVEILLEEPVRSYKSIAIVVATDEGWELPLEDIKKKLVEKAAILGGDAVIIGRESQSAGAVIVPIGSSYYAGAVNETKLVGKVIIYTDSSGSNNSSDKTISGKRVEERYVQNNTFYSTNKPEINIKINDSFQYLGHIEMHSKWKKYKIKADNYLFSLTGDNNTVRKYVHIKIRKISGHYFSTKYYNLASNPIDQGNSKINGEQYEYFIYKVDEKDVSWHKKELSKRGLKLSASYLYKSIVRRIPPKNDVVMYISFWEEISNKFTDKNWESANYLSDEQRNMVSDLVSHFDKSIKILDSKDIALTTNSAPDKIQKNNEIQQSSALGEKLKTLNDLRESGLITQEDYNKKKDELLERF